MQALKQALEAFLKSDDFAEGITKSTKASWGGSGYSVELFEDETWRVLWNNEIGNLYETPGLIMKLPVWDDSDYQETVNAADPALQLSEEEYFEQCAINEKDDLAQEMRDDLYDRSVRYAE